ncbi:MAG: FKBP-type peptidyl-prolyl cis-trans isomerase [Elusimicrobia bacterium]|nr:FKBP-type peptidyl-prolyl cis-trans isomerase [Elusimicrobiota bacterium]
MKNVFFAVIVSLPLALSAQQPQTEKEAPINPDKALYSLGVALSQNLIGYNFNESEADKITAGFSDSLKNKAKKEDYDFAEISPYISKKQQENAKVEKEKGSAYSKKAANEKGAQKSKTGLIYIPITKGKGISPKAEDEVKVHYKGYLIDGKPFDSSYDRKEPAQFPLGAVISCWTEGVQKMKVGGKAKLVCPSDIAYGDMGRPPVIPGGATLVFEVELLDVIKKEQKKEEKAPVDNKKQENNQKPTEEKK